MRNYDHFHLTYKLPEGVRAEHRPAADLHDRKGEPRWTIEGGWRDFPAGWDKRTEDEQAQFWHQLGVAWGMPEEGIVTAVRLAG
jgi:hypothetical protein